MLQKQAEKNYLCSLIDKRKTMKHTNPQVEQMTSFIVMDVLERANELQKQGIDVVHLEVGEPDFDVPSCVAEAAKAAYDQHLTHYTHSLGDPELRGEIAAFYQREYGVVVDPEQGRTRRHPLKSHSRGLTRGDGNDSSAIINL